MAKNQIISINFQGIKIGKIGYDENQRKSSFQYNPDFLESNIYKKIFPYVIRRTPNVLKTPTLLAEILVPVNKEQ